MTIDSKEVRQALCARIGSGELTPAQVQDHLAELRDQAIAEGRQTLFDEWVAGQAGNAA